MQGVGAPVWGFDPQVVAQEAARDKVRERTRGASIVKARLELPVAAAVYGYFPATLERSALGGQIDDPRGAQPVFGGQGARDDAHGCNQSGIERLPEYADAFGKNDAVQAVLQTVMFAANVELAKGVLRHLRGLHD